MVDKAVEDEPRLAPLDQVFVVVKYSTTREYAGPEEGGWYYTDQTFDKVIVAHTYENHAIKACQNLNQQRDDDPDGGFHYTVRALPWWDDDPDGDSCHAGYDEDGPAPVLRLDIPEHLPEHRPHYC